MSQRVSYLDGGYLIDSLVLGHQLPPWILPQLTVVLQEDEQGDLLDSVVALRPC